MKTKIVTGLFLCAGIAVMMPLSAAQAAAFKPVRTPVIRGGEKARTLTADVTGVKDLYLVATIGGDTYNHDQAIWAEPRLFDRDGRAVDLTTLKPAGTSVGWGQFHVNTAHSGAGLSIGGAAFAKGFYAHAPSALHFKLDGRFTRFEALVGIATASGANGSVEFEVTDSKPKTEAPAETVLKASPAATAPHQFGAAAAQTLLGQGIGQLLFVRRFTLTCSHVYTEHIDSRWTPGGGLCVLDLKSGAVTDLTPELDGGVVNRFDLAFDAKSVVFDYKKSAKDGYRIYEMQLDPATGLRRAGTPLRQLTFSEPNEAELSRRYGYGVNDMHPCYLPDGSIIFTSTRCRTSTLCNSADVYTTTVLHRMDADGRNIRRLSHNCVSEFSPAVLPDGRVLYMRWEYNRKGAGAVKGLWAMLPDGSAASEVYGNLIVDPETMLYGRPVPGAPDQILFLGCSHWGPNNGVGTVILLDTKQSTASRDAMTLVTRDVDAQTHGGYTFQVGGKWVNESTGAQGRLFKDPYPLSDKLFLAALKSKGLRWDNPKGYELCLLDAQGNASTLYRDEEIACWHPFPVRARVRPPQPALPSNPDLAGQQMAQCVVADVYAGLSGVPRGAVKHIRILEQTPRPWTARNTWPGDVQAMAHTALGPYLLGMQAQYGVVPVEDDGSANFLVPAGPNIYFQVLDENFLAIQTERTYVNYQPGETRSCVGCHDRARTGAAVESRAVSKALKRAPSRPAPQPGDTAGKKLFDYERQIQPVWNAHCVRCHDATTNAPAGLDLTGRQTALHNASYESLLRLGAKPKQPRQALVGVQVDENDVRAYVEHAPPYFFGAYSSVLAGVFGSFEPRFQSAGPGASTLAERVKALRAKHSEVKLSKAEFVRVANWLDASCQYYPSYWGQKNLKYKESPYYRPEVSFDEAVGAPWPAALQGLYDPRR